MRLPNLENWNYTSSTQFVWRFDQCIGRQIRRFCLQSGRWKIAAYRVILAARSPVFDAMFQHDMKEKRTNETEIEDATPAAFKALLRFIYTGHCEVGMLAEELLVAANKYDIQDLKEICAKELHKKLTVDNAVHLLILSDLHQTNDLKRAAIRFINKNAEYVMKTASWFNLLKCFKIFSKCVLGKLGTRLSGLLKSNQNKLDYALSSHWVTYLSTNFYKRMLFSILFCPTSCVCCSFFKCKSWIQVSNRKFLSIY